MQHRKSLLIFAIVLTACGSSNNIIHAEAAKTTITEATIPVVEVEVVECELEQPKSKKITETVSEVVEINELVETFNHKSFDVLLKENVTKDGVVNYAGFMKKKKELRSYIVALGENMPTENWTIEDKLAYWMNAYNAMTVDLILKHYPLQSIKDIDKPWNQRLWKLGDKWYDLDEIEHQILRKMNDPRIHFGINCASFSCPPLLNEAFTSEKVDAQLDDLAKRFVNDSRRNSISENELSISKIFNWFAKDFKKNGTLIDFLNTYSKIKINAKAKVRYMDYNWDLND